MVEIVERKGLGHPDTICDALAETLLRSLSREYRNHFGAVLHHNVDKALLRGGRAARAFGGGDVVEPIGIYLAGRATTEIAGHAIPLREIAVEGSRAWLRDNLHALDPERHVHVQAPRTCRSCSRGSPARALHWPTIRRSASATRR